MLTNEMHAEPLPHPETAPRRAPALDALRGLAIGGMIFASLLPKDLPGWMFHAQTPPPAFKFDPAVAGITWVDLVFPMFIFSMGAAIPLAMHARTRRGVKSRPAWGYFVRSLLLIALALFIRHTSPWVFQARFGGWAPVLGIAGFCCMGLVLWRPPSGWPRWRAKLLRVIGWTGAATLTYTAVNSGTIGWDPGVRHDIILVILANASFFGFLVWRMTRRSMTGRLLIIAAGLAWYIACHYYPPLSKAVGWQFLAPVVPPDVLRHMAWAANPGYLRYLFVLLPGTIVGDLLVKWMQPDPISLNESMYNSRWRDLSPARCLLLGAGCLGATVVTIVGMYSRLLEWTALLNMLILGITVAAMFSPPRTTSVGRRYSMFRGQMRLPASVYRHLTVWSAFWLAIGLAAEPFEGGIHKDPTTLSYLFVTAGLAGLLLVTLSVIVELAGPRVVSLLALNGQNPVMAYTVMNFLVQPVLQLVPAGNGQCLGDALVNQFPSGWPGVGRGAAITLTGIIIVAIATRLRIIWRL